MFHQKITTRFQAFLAHLVCSIIVALLVLALVFVIWYPDLLAKATGVDEIFFIVLGVDVCLGPLLTLAVFNLKKKELKRDLFIIFALQIGALLYGLYTVGIVRPAYVVFEIDRFQLVYANDLSKEKIANATHEKFRSMPYFGPRWVTALLPTDIEERNKVLFSVLEGGEDISQFPRFYAPLAESKDEIAKRAMSLEMLEEYNLDNLATYQALIDRYSSASSNVGYLPLKGFALDIVVVVDKSSADVLELVNLRPWGL